MDTPPPNTADSHTVSSDGLPTKTTTLNFTPEEIRSGAFVKRMLELQSFRQSLTPAHTISPPVGSISVTSNSSGQEDSKLLALPGELKNRIYRYALLESPDTRIRISKDGYVRPALLNTCKEIRFEALKIFYYENHFTVDIRNYDHTPAIRWYLTQDQMGINPYRLVAYEVNGDPNWKSLLRGLKAYHEFKVHGNPYKPDKLLKKGLSLANGGARAMQWFLIGSMFKTTHRMRMQPWEVLRGILQAMRTSLIAVDAKWAENS